MSKLNFISLFAGAGGFSEGFIRQGFHLIAHVESDKAACFTLKTRAAFHYLINSGDLKIYSQYLKGEISRENLYSHIPDNLLNSVINLQIGKDNDLIFKMIDKILDGDKVDLIIGGPPCQSYSKIGRPALKHRTNDERKILYLQYGRFLKKYNPKIFVFENVPGIFVTDKGQYFRNLQIYYKRLGYRLEAKVYNAYDFGVVQNRERVIVIGWKKDLNFKYPDLKKLNEIFYRDDIFQDLPAIRPGESQRYHYYTKPANQYLSNTSIRNGFNFVSQHIAHNHNIQDLNIYKLAIQKLKEGTRLKNNKIPVYMRTQKNLTDFLDRFKVVDKIPHTMIAHIAKDGHHYIHPDINQLRSISVREAARIQSFPDDYYFEGAQKNKPRTAAYRQIGNAVPPLMAEKIAEKIKELLNAKY